MIYYDSFTFELNRWWIPWHYAKQSSEQKRTTFPKWNWLFPVSTWGSRYSSFIVLALRVVVVFIFLSSLSWSKYCLFLCIVPSWPPPFSVFSNVYCTYNENIYKFQQLFMLTLSCRNHFVRLIDDLDTPAT